MSNITNSTDESIAGSFIAAFGPIIIIGCFGFCFYQWYQGYKKRKKRRFDYKPVQVVNAVPVAQAPRVVNAVPVQTAMPVSRIIPPVQAIDEDVKLRQFFRAWRFTSFPCRKIDLDRLSTLVNSGFNIDKVFYAGASMYVTLRAQKYADDKTYLIDLMFEENQVLENNPLSQPESNMKTDRIVSSYSPHHILRIYNLYKESDITG